MEKMLCCLIISLIGFVPIGYSQTVKILYSKSSPQATYAAGMVEKSLTKKAYSLSGSKADFLINVVINPAQLGSEAYLIATDGKKITITGGDERGMIYGSLSVAEDVRNGTRLENIKPRSEKPNYALRAVKFDLPWDTYRHSLALDLHYETCKDVNYWKAFLDMMAENRLNSLSLWNLHPYTFMIKPKNFPEASPFNDEEMKEWKNFFSSIFRMAKERAIDT